MCENSKRLHIEIATFHSPHLFWFVETNSKFDRFNLESKLKESVGKSLLADPIVGEVVTVNDGAVWKRAKVKTIHGNEYVCWLLDYGVIFKTTEVYELPDQFKILPSFAKQASLADVVYLYAELNPETSEIDYSETTNFQSGAVQVMLKHLKEAKDIIFSVSNERDEIYFGDIILSDKLKFYSLTKAMIEDKILKINKELFITAMEKYDTNSQECFGLLLSSRSSSRSSSCADSKTVNDSFEKVPFIPVAEGLGRGRRVEPKLVNLDTPKEKKLSSKTALNKLRLLKPTDSDAEDTLNNSVVDGEFYSDKEEKENATLDDVDKPPEKLNIENATLDDVVRPPKKLNIVPEGCILSNRKNVSTTARKSISSNSHQSNALTKSLKTSSSSVKSSSSEYFESDAEAAAAVKHRKKKIGCSCDNCLTWDTNDLKPEEKEQFGSDQKRTKIVKKPPLLLKTGTEETFSIKSLGSVPSFAAAKRMIDKLPTLLVHGVMIPSPCQSLGDIYFHEHVHGYLRKLNFNHARHIQTYVWPAVLRLMTVCYISSAASGKTMGYVPAICSFMLEHGKYSIFRDSMTGPIVLVICKGIRKAEEVYHLFNTFFRSARTKINVVLAVPPLDAHCLKRFDYSCDILVTTPLSLMSLLTSRKINMKRLCHVVFEDMDFILEKYSEQIEMLINLIQRVLENRNYNIGVQVIMSAEHWTFQIESLLNKFLLPPLVCISAYLEAAIYGKVNMKVHFMESKLKQSLLVDILTSEENYYNKCIVICNTDDEMKEASFLFPNRSISYITLDGSLPETDINARENQWNSSKDGCYPVLICTDDVFNKNLSITDATLLIHYSLPLSWTHFSQRFSCFLDNIVSPLDKKNTVQIRCKSYIFVDENCIGQCPRLIHFLQSMDVKISAKFREYYKSTLIMQEEKKIEDRVKLCKTLKLLGNCNNKKCNSRHTLSKKLDDSAHIPKNGTIKYKIVNVQDVTVYSVNILEYSNLNGSIIKNNHNFSSIDESLTNELAKEHSYISNPQIGDWTALETVNSPKDIIYRRCEVTKIVERGSITKLPSLVRIVLLDVGIEMNVKVTSLFVLPENFRTIPPQAVTVYFANMVPPEHDENFRSYSKQKVISLLATGDETYENSVYTSDILLQIGNNLWVKDIHLVQHISLISSTVTLLKLKEKLLEQHLANYQDNCLEKLKELCVHAAIPIPICENESVKKPTKYVNRVTPQWAFLDDSEEYNEVYFSAANSPNEFYVRLKKFQDLFEKLQKDIQEAVKRTKYPNGFDVVVGGCYLARDECGDDYCRVQVTEIKDGVADCFCVDYGDQQYVQVSELKYLQDDFISRLPFQVIECSLYGIGPILDRWCPEATDTFYQYHFETGTDYYRTLYTVIREKGNARLTGGKKFGVLLADISSGKQTVFNKLLFDCGFAISTVEEDFMSEMPDISQLITDKYYEDSEEDEDVRECTIQEYNELRSEGLVKDDFLNEGIIEKIEKTESSNTGSEHSWDLEVFNPELLLLGSDIKQLEKKTKEAIPNVTELPFMRALPSPSYNTPFVEWYQTEVHTKLHILLSGVRDYVLKVIRGKVLHFSCTHNEKPYRLDLQLYDNVEKTFLHTAVGPTIKIALTKCRKGEWPRLTVQKKLIHVTYDMSRNIFMKDKKTIRKFLEFPEEFSEKLLSDDEHEIVIGSDFDDSDSDVSSSSSN